MRATERALDFDDVAVHWEIIQLKLSFPPWLKKLFLRYPQNSFVQLLISKQIFSSIEIIAAFLKASEKYFFYFHWFLFLFIEWEKIVQMWHFIIEAQKMIRSDILSSWNLNNMYYKQLKYGMICKLIFPSNLFELKQNKCLGIFFIMRNIVCLYCIE